MLVHYQVIFLSCEGLDLMMWSAFPNTVLMHLTIHVREPTAFPIEFLKNVSVMPLLGCNASICWKLNLKHLYAISRKCNLGVRRMQLHSYHVDKAPLEFSRKIVRWHIRPSSSLLCFCQSNILIIPMRRPLMPY